MHRWMRLFCRQQSAPLCRPTGQRHSNFCGFPVAVSIGRASWNRPRLCRNLLHFVVRSALVQKILRSWSLSCPAFSLSFSASGHSGFWQHRGWFRRLFPPRSTPAHRHYLPHIGRFPGVPQTGRHGRRTSRASAPCSNGLTHPGSVPLFQTADAGLFLPPYPHRVSAFSF